MNAGPPRGASLQALFAPASVAIVGASKRTGNLFARPLHYLLRHGYKGAIYLVNPKYDEISGRPVFPDVTAIGEPVDLALLLVPATAVVDQLAALGGIGASAAIVFASGFGESGADGAALQRCIVEEARRHGIRLLGPNCQGVIDMATGLAATFTGAAERPFRRFDGVAYVGQSGAISGSLLVLACEAGIGLTAWLSTGNEADIDSLEAAQFLLERDDVRTALVYLESSPDPVRYADLARTLARVEALGARPSEAEVASAVVSDVTVDVGSLRRRASHTGLITERTGASLLDAFGIPHPAGALVRSAAEARRIADALGGPLVCKLQSPALTHKSDSGALRIGVGVDEVGDVVTQLLAVATDLGSADGDVEGVLVQAMAPPGVQLLVSVLGGEQGYSPVATVGSEGSPPSSIRTWCRFSCPRPGRMWPRRCGRCGAARSCSATAAGRQWMSRRSSTSSMRWGL